MKHRKDFENHRELDARLGTTSQRDIARLVAQLPDEVPSMAWRSELNERIRQAAKIERRRAWFRWVAGPTAGLAFAGALAMVVLTLPRPESDRVATRRSLEAALVQQHELAIQVSDVTGAGLGYEEATNPPPTPEPTLTDYDEADLLPL